MLTTASCELSFASLFDTSRAFTFPCDGAGHVDLDALSERQPINYFWVRVAIGRAVAWPRVQSALLP